MNTISTAVYTERAEWLHEGRRINLDEMLIAPCGMNCGLCVAYLGMKNDLNRLGFHRKYCPGCIPRGEHCLHMADGCELLRDGRLRFCFECENFPCRRLRALDKRYRTKYHMSMLENLLYIRDKGIAEFLEKERNAWRCNRCGGTICCHNGLCPACDTEILQKNRKYRWDE